MAKQKLTPKAAAAKLKRDLAYAKTPLRRARKAQNQRIGQSSDKDIHHKPDGSVAKVSIKNNRGNFGKGTKKENMKKPFKLKYTDGKKASPAKMFGYAEQKQMLADRNANLNQRFDDSMAEQQRQQQQQSMMGPGAMTPQEQMVQDRQDKLDEIKRSIEELSNR